MKNRFRKAAGVLFLAASTLWARADAQTVPVTIVQLDPRDNAYFVQVSAAIGTCTQSPTNLYYAYVDIATGNYAAIKSTLMLAAVLQRPVVLYLDTAPCVLNQGAYYNKIKGLDLTL